MMELSPTAEKMFPFKTKLKPALLTLTNSKPSWTTWVKDMKWKDAKDTKVQEEVTTLKVEMEPDQWMELTQLMLLMVQDQSTVQTPLTPLEETFKPLTKLTPPTVQDQLMELTQPQTQLTVLDQPTELTLLLTQLMEQDQPTVPTQLMELDQPMVQTEQIQLMALDQPTEQTPLMALDQTTLKVMVLPDHQSPQSYQEEKDLALAFHVIKEPSLKSSSEPQPSELLSKFQLLQETSQPAQLHQLQFTFSTTMDQLAFTQP